MSSVYTPTDKRRAVSVLLADPEWAVWSNYQIADACAVSAEFVRLRRHEQPPTVGSSPESRKGADGKTRNMPKLKTYSVTTEKDGA